MEEFLMSLFVPEAIYIDPAVEKYPEAFAIKKNISKLGVPTFNSKIVRIEKKSPLENYIAAKSTVLLTVNKEKELQSCHPSSDFQFSLSSSCPGNCQYCYLQTSQGKNPVIKLFVNVYEIMALVNKYVENNLPKQTVFECASLTDPVSLEHLTGNLTKVIEYFSTLEKARLRIVTKFHNVEPFLNLDHKEHTKFRFSINTKYVIHNFESKTPPLKERLVAARTIATAGYPIGFILAPIMIYPNWKEEYSELLTKVREAFDFYKGPISFELIQHRFTKTAKNLILQRFPQTKLDLDEENRQLKWGAFGQFKHIYKKDSSTEIKEFLTQKITQLFSNGSIEYFT